jgi:hypothetical protein
MNSPLASQHQALKQNFVEYMGKAAQRDDVTLLGFSAREIFVLKHLHTLYRELRQGGIMFCFSGPTSQSVVEGIGQALKRELELEEAGMATIQRVFFHLCRADAEHYPLLHRQNAAGHRQRRRTQIWSGGGGALRGPVLCHMREQGEPVQAEKLLERIRHLQQLDKQALNELYRRMRREKPDDDSKGAGLGFVEMFRRASEPLECHVVPIDGDTVFFSIKAIG